MKASESNAHYTNKVRECTNYSVRGIKNLFKNEDLKPRYACSQGDDEIQKQLQGELQNFCDDVYCESFSASINSHKVSNIFVFVFMILSAAAIVGANFVSEALLFISVGFSILAFASFCGLFGKLAKDKKGTNIIATRKALGVATNKVVFCANTDAPFKRRFLKGTENLARLTTIVGIFLQLIYDAVLLGSVYYKLFDLGSIQMMTVISYVLIVFVPFPLVCAFAVKTNTGTPGVANNLSGSFACLGAMRYLSEFDLKLDNTDVCVILTGAKNANLAGAKAYAKVHGADDKKMNPLFVCVDTLKGIETLSVKGGTIKGKSLVKQAGENANISLPDCSAKYLKSDATAFAKAGINCATITTLSSTVPDFYGTNLDNIDNLDTKSTEAAINILLESAYLVDSKNK
ncbi:MAG: M28 family peptidase [Clostridia bacterium]|nr:M28 family peptidase [Clostridia bacterium]